MLVFCCFVPYGRAGTVSGTIDAKSETAEKEQHHPMTDYIEGKRPVIEALRTDVPIEQVLIADNLKRDGLVEDILRKAKKADVPVKTVRHRDLDERSERGSHQGVMAEAKPYEYCNVQTILDAAEAHAAEHDGAALVVLLDHITDAGNLGAIARSAEVVGASGIVIPNKRSAHVTAATYKSSAGAISHLNVSQVANIAQVIERLKKEEERLTKELARVNGMLGNEKFVSKAPQSKIDEEKAKLEKYTQMMDQVKERLSQLQ